MPSYGTGSIAYLRYVPPSPQYGISASGRFKVLAGGCSQDGTDSKGNLPFLRLFDANGKRVAGLYRINGSCSKTAKLYVQHSGNFERTGVNIGFGTWNQLELRISVSDPGRSLVQVYVNGRLVFSRTTADNGVLPIAGVTTHNEHSNQVGDLVADDVRVARFDVAPPTDPCRPADTPAPATGDPGTVVLADAFETQGFPAWTAVTRLGDAIVNLQPDHVRSGNCAGLIRVSSTSGSKGNIYKTLPAGTREVWMDGFYSVLRRGSVDTSNVPLTRFFLAGARKADVYRQNGTGAMWLRVPDGSGGYTSYSLGRTLALGEWVNVKVHAVSTPETQRVEVWVDGVLKRSLDAPTIGTGGFDQAMVGAEHFVQEGDLAVDDVVIKRVP